MKNLSFSKEEIKIINYINQLSLLNCVYTKRSFTNINIYIFIIYKAFLFYDKKYEKYILKLYLSCHNILL